MDFRDLERLPFVWKTDVNFPPIFFFVNKVRRDESLHLTTFESLPLERTVYHSRRAEVVFQFTAKSPAANTNARSTLPICFPF